MLLNLSYNAHTFENKAKWSSRIQTASNESETTGSIDSHRNLRVRSALWDKIAGRMGGTPRLPESITSVRSVSPSWSGNRPATPDDARIFCPRTVKRRRRSRSEARQVWPGGALFRCALHRPGRDDILWSPTRLLSISLFMYHLDTCDRLSECREPSRLIRGEPRSWNILCYIFLVHHRKVRFRNQCIK